MSINDDIFNDLRKKLDLMGYKQTLPVLGIPLVTDIFEDLIKTTASLRDAKKQIVDLLEEKSCWELGVEPYKCSNARLVRECNELNQQLLKDRDEYELRICECNQKIRNLQADKQHIEAHSQQLQQQLDAILAKQVDVNKKKTQGPVSQKGKRPFITTVRSGNALPQVPQINSIGLRCTKCNAGVCQKTDEEAIIAETHNISQEEYTKLKNSLKDNTDQLEYYKRKIDGLNREIQRLSNLLVGGRPPVALARDCCQKDAIEHEYDLLKRESTEQLNEIRKYQDMMHDAMQRALQTENEKRKLKQDLEELKNTALQVESQANTEIASRDNEIFTLQAELKDLRSKSSHTEVRGKKPQNKRIAGGNDMSADRHALKERINVLTQRESELKTTNEKLKRKLHKLDSKMSDVTKELNELQKSNAIGVDEEKIRLKSERDFFQNEYLRLMSKTSSATQIEFLQSQIKSKDEELRNLRSDMCLRDITHSNKPIPQTINIDAKYESLPTSARSMQSSRESDCVQAAIMRVERERDCARAELARVCRERDTLREKHLHMCQMHSEELQAARRRSEDLHERLTQYERENRELNSDLMPRETQIVLLKDEISHLKQRYSALQDDHAKLKTQYSQLKIVHEQSERSLVDIQTKLTIAERQLQTADMRFNDINSNRDSKRSETAQLLNDVASLKHTYKTLESDKDKLLNQLDAKTEHTIQLEYELKYCKDERNRLEVEVQTLKEQMHEFNVKTKKSQHELSNALAECKTLRQQLAVLKSSSEQAFAENGRLTNDLSDSQAELRIVRKKLDDSELEIERMKQQLRQYVQEVKRAEDLLTQKERERDEMLEHYQSLSHDAVMLEGNNHSLEAEATEYKRQICELESEVAKLKKEACCRQDYIERLEDKISTLTTNITCLERQLDEAIDTLRLRNEDITARKELCEKLDVEKSKLNAELTELNDIHKKLERENDQLRNELSKLSKGQSTSTEAMSDLLATTRQELEKQIATDVKLNQELERLRQQLDVVMRDLDKERQQCKYQKTLAHEFQTQVEELRQNLTDDRFRQARSNEENVQNHSN